MGGMLGIPTSEQNPLLPCPSPPQPGVVPGVVQQPSILGMRTARTGGASAAGTTTFVKREWPTGDAPAVLAFVNLCRYFLCSALRC